MLPTINFGKFSEVQGCVIQHSHLVVGNRIEIIYWEAIMQLVRHMV